MSKTIKQIADELGVSKQAVSKCIDNLGLRSTLTKNGNYFVVGDNQERAIKQAFAAHQTANQNANQNANQTPTELAAVIGVLQTTIDTLKGQLDAKDEQMREQLAAKDNQIRGQQAQIEQLTVALQQQTSALESTTAALTAAQALHAADKKALILMEDKEKQSDPFYSDENMERLQRSAEQMERTGELVNSERKLSFWERRAAKKAEKKARKEGKQ